MIIFAQLNVNIKNLSAFTEILPFLDNAKINTNCWWGIQVNFKSFLRQRFDGQLHVWKNKVHFSWVC